jgi:hypothetical protein
MMRIAAVLIGALLPATAAADIRSDFERIIRAEGYVCPRLKMVDYRGIEPRGHVYRLWCGDNDGTRDVIASLVYKAWVHENVVKLLIPWPGDPHKR